jgi:hypothetical protein
MRWDHLHRLTDCTGLIQHATYSLPDLASGYTTDDNSRALAVLMRAPDTRADPGLQRLAERYLSFLAYAQTATGWFRNFMDYSRRFLDEEGSEDCFGRALVACAEVMVGEDAHPTRGATLLARRLWSRALPHAPRLRAPRARALTLVALQRYHEAFPQPRLQTLAHSLGESLLHAYRNSAAPGWRWFEDTITYSNGVLPQGIMAAYLVTGQRKFLRAGRETLDFLNDCCFRRGYLKLVGNRHWYRRGTTPADFDEQPVDAAHLVEANLVAYLVTGASCYRELALRAAAWFHGHNQLGISLVDSSTGGCYDGLTPDGVNLNQGAESLLAHLWTQVLIRELQAAHEDVPAAGSS